jgi:hypothetical protein
MSESHASPAPTEGYEHFWRAGEKQEPPPGETGSEPTVTAYERFVAAVEG